MTLTRLECSDCGVPWASHPTVALPGGGWSTACPDGRAVKVEYVPVAEVERLQTAVDKAAGVMRASEYVGGPTERDAWRTAYAALCAVETQHVGQGRAS